VAEPAPVCIGRDDERYSVCARPSHGLGRESPGLQRLGYAVSGKGVQEPGGVAR
jgi:hypothetical protein